MGDRFLIYSYVAKGTTVLVEYPAVSGNVGMIASQCLASLPPGNNKHSFVCGFRMFNFLVADGITYLAVADEGFGRTIPFSFLERVEENFRQRYAGVDLAVAVATEGGLSAEFGPVLKSHMEYMEANVDEMLKISRIKTQVAEVQGIMNVNNQIAGRTDSRIDFLAGRMASQHGSTNMNQYQKPRQRSRPRGAMLCAPGCANYKLKMFALAMVVILTFVVYLSVCRGFKCYEPFIPGISPKAPPPQYYQAPPIPRWGGWGGSD